MKKYLLSISAVTAMLAMTSVFTACSSDDEEQKSLTHGTLILDADKSNYADVDESGTRALAVDGTTIKTYWDKDKDKVTVFASNWKNSLGTLTPQPDKVPAGSPEYRTKLEGPITYSNLKVGDALNLIFPRPEWQYTGQKGTIEDISENFDYITTDISVVYIDPNTTGNPVYSTTALFGKAQQAIVKFTLLNGDGSALQLPDNPELSITTASNQLVTKCNLDGTAAEKGGALIIKKENSSNEFYVAIRNNNEDKDQYTLSIKDKNGKFLTYTKSDITFARGDYKKINVKMKFYDQTYTERVSYDDQGEETWE
jgi:hypothetical protein